MTDYGHDLLFGTFVTPQAAQAARVVDLARLTEQVGLDLVSVQDHPYQAKFLDAWTLLSVIAARTTRLRVLPNVANVPLRPPAVLARSVSTLDILSGGRVELGLGAGAFWDGIAAMGGTRLTTAQAVDALDEAIQIIRTLWTQTSGSVRVDGEYHHVHGARPGPPPAHDIGIWVGAYKPRMLALTGRLADGWLPSSPYAGPDQLSAMNAAIDAAAESAGRAPATIRRVYNLAGTFTAYGSGFLDGPPAMWAEQLAELTLTEGMSGYIVMGDDPEVIRRFAGDVAPAVREQVAAERARGATTPDAERQTVTVATTVASGQSTVVVPASSVRLGVTPTPDDGVRRSEVQLWDEQTRPVAPAPDPARTYTPAQRASGQHLIDVHDHLRGELASILDLVEQVAAGSLDVAAARNVLNAMAIRQNNWTLGAYCESFCRLVTAHHTVEDVSLFPRLRDFDPALNPVLERLEEEHHIIHEVLDGVDRALVRLVSEADGMKQLRAAADLLSDTLLSHLSYEERSLVEPLARLGLM